MSNRRSRTNRGNGPRDWTSSHTSAHRSHRNMNLYPVTVVTADGRRLHAEPGELVQWIDTPRHVGQPYEVLGGPRANQLPNPTYTRGSWARATGSADSEGWINPRFVMFGDEATHAWREQFILDEIQPRPWLASVENVARAAERISAPMASATEAMTFLANSMAQAAHHEGTVRRTMTGNVSCACGTHWDHRWEHGPDGCSFRELGWNTFVNYDEENDDADEDDD